MECLLGEPLGNDIDYEFSGFQYVRGSVLLLATSHSNTDSNRWRIVTYHVKEGEGC